MDQGPRESESDFCFGGCAQGPAPAITPSHVLVFGTSLGLMPPDLALGAWAGPEVSLGGRRLARAAGPLAWQGPRARRAMSRLKLRSSESE